MVIVHIAILSMQFTDQVEENFEGITVEVVNTYCLVFERSCTVVSIGVEILCVNAMATNC